MYQWPSTRPKGVLDLLPPLLPLASIDLTVSHACVGKVGEGCSGQQRGVGVGEGPLASSPTAGVVAKVAGLGFEVAGPPMACGS